MPKEQIFNNPEQLTVDKLKRELSKRGIPFPNKAKKAEYVSIYVKEVLNKQQKPAASSFSSDEETFLGPRITRQKTKVKSSQVRVQLEKLEYSNNMTQDDLDVRGLSDDELREELAQRGFNVGPIGPTTRRLYERRLQDVLKNGGAGDLPDEQEYSDEESDQSDEVDVEDHPVPMDTRNKRRSVLQSSVMQSGSATRRRPLRQVQSSRREEEFISRTERIEAEEVEEPQQKPAAPSSEPKSEPLKSERRWLPVWMQIIFVLGLAFFLYLVIQSMESNPRKSIGN